MALIATSSLTHIEPGPDPLNVLTQFLTFTFIGQFDLVGLLCGRHEAHFDRVIDIVAAEEDLRPLIDRLQQNRAALARLYDGDMAQRNQIPSRKDAT